MSKMLSIFILLIQLTSCIKYSVDSNSRGSTSTASISVTYSDALIKVTTNNAAPAAFDQAMVAANDTGNLAPIDTLNVATLVTASPASTNTADPSTANLGSAPALVPDPDSDGNDGYKTVDATDGVNAILSLTYPGKVTSDACVLTDLFSSLSCNLASIVITDTQIVADGTFKINVSQGNGTRASTGTIHVSNYEVKKISNLMVTGDDFSHLTDFNDELYLVGILPPGGRGAPTKLMHYNKTDHTIYQVSNVNGGGADTPTSLTVHEGKLYFTAGSGVTGHLYSYTPGTNIIRQIANTTGTYNPDDYSGGGFQPFTVIGDKLYFSANNGANVKLHYFDIAADSVTEVSNIVPGIDDAITCMREFKGDPYFVSYLPPGGRGAPSKLFKFDLADNEIQQISEISGPANGDNPEFLTVFNQKLYFTAMLDALGNKKLHSYDSSSNTIKQETDLVPGGSDNIFSALNSSDSSGQNTFETDGVSKLFFPFRNALGLTKMLLHDTLTHTTTQIADISPGADDGADKATYYEKSIFFSGYLAPGGRASPTKLFHYDLSKSQLEQASDITNTLSDIPVGAAELVKFDNKLFFGAYSDGVANTKLFCFDPQSKKVVQISDTNPGGDDMVTKPKVVGDRLYFTGSDGTGRRLYALCKGPCN